MTTLFTESYQNDTDLESQSFDNLTVLTACALDPMTGQPVMKIADQHEHLLQLERQPRPKEVEFILTALEAGHLSPEHDRRSQTRKSIRTTAEVQLFSDRPGTAPRVIYTRDASSRSMGFISKQRLPLGYGGRIQLRGPHGEDLDIACTVIRCQLAISGWYEGSVSFNREQFAFDQCNSNDAD